MAVHSAKGIIRLSVQTDINRFKRRGNSTVLRAKSPPFSSNLGSKQTSLTQPSSRVIVEAYFGTSLYDNMSLRAHSVPNLRANRTPASQFTHTLCALLVKTCNG